VRETPVRAFPCVLRASDARAVNGCWGVVGGVGVSSPGKPYRSVRTGRAGAIGSGATNPTPNRRLTQ
jgi:hypothetical protein